MLFSFHSKPKTEKNFSYKTHHVTGEDISFRREKCVEAKIRSVYDSKESVKSCLLRVCAEQTAGDKCY